MENTRESRGEGRMEKRSPPSSDGIFPGEERYRGRPEITFVKQESEKNLNEGSGRTMCT